MTPYQEKKLDDLLSGMSSLNSQVAVLNAQLGGSGGVFDRLNAHSDRFQALEARHAEEIRRIDVERAKDREAIEDQRRLAAKGLGVVTGVAFIGAIIGGFLKVAILKVLGWD